MQGSQGTTYTDEFMVGFPTRSGFPVEPVDPLQLRASLLSQFNGLVPLSTLLCVFSLK